VLVALAIYSQAELVAHLLHLIQAEQVVAVQVIVVQAVTHQVTLAVLAEMAEAVAEALTTLEPLALVATAYFIFTTKENKCLHLQ
jgi:hypothetical protein